MACALAVILERTEGASLDIQLTDSRRGWILSFDRDAEKKVLVFRSRPPEENEIRGGVTPTHQEVQQHLTSPIVT